MTTKAKKIERPTGRPVKVIERKFQGARSQKNRIQGVHIMATKPRMGRS